MNTARNNAASVVVCVGVGWCWGTFDRACGLITPFEHGCKQGASPSLYLLPNSTASSHHGNCWALGVLL